MWITLTSEDVMEEFNDREAAALNAIKGREALAGIVARVVARVRGSVLAGGGALGAEGTIPDSLAGDAVAIARWKFLISVAQNQALQTKERQAAADAGEERLLRVEEGKLRVEAPEGSAGAATGGSSPAMETRTLNFDRTSQDGI